MAQSNAIVTTVTTFPEDTAIHVGRVLGTGTVLSGVHFANHGLRQMAHHHLLIVVVAVHVGLH